MVGLSLFPDHYLPGHHNLHCKVLADHHFDRGELSSCAVALTEIQISPPPFPEGTGVELPERGKELGRDIPVNHAESKCEYDNTLAQYGARIYAELLPVSLARPLGGGELDIPMQTPTVGLEPTTTRLRALRSAD